MPDVLEPKAADGVVPLERSLLHGLFRAAAIRDDGTLRPKEEARALFMDTIMAEFAAPGEGIDPKRFFMEVLKDAPVSKLRQWLKEYPDDDGFLQPLLREELERRAAPKRGRRRKRS